MVLLICRAAQWIVSQRLAPFLENSCVSDILQCSGSELQLETKWFKYRFSAGLPYILNLYCECTWCKQSKINVSNRRFTGAWQLCWQERSHPAPHERTGKMSTQKGTRERAVTHVWAQWARETSWFGYFIKGQGHCLDVSLAGELAVVCWLGNKVFL